MKYLKKFENHTAYEAAESGLILPNVSLCVQENDVHYNPFVDPCQQYDYVEIGGIKWATKNVGACSVTDYGLYFQWGDTQGYAASEVGSGEGQKYFGWADYKYSNDDGSVMTKYNSTDGKTVLDASDDAATVNMGSNWRMPTDAEFRVLGNAVNASYTNDYNGTGIGGIICRASNGSGAELFFPYAGSCVNGKTYIGSNGRCWSKTLTYNKDTAFKMIFGESGIYWSNDQYNRSRGFSVRGVFIG